MLWLLLRIPKITTAFRILSSFSLGMSTSLLVAVACLLLLTNSASGQMCPNNLAATLANVCARGSRCTGECVTFVAPAAGDMCAAPVVACPQATGKCVNEQCMMVSTDQSACPGGMCATGMYCVNGQCLPHTNPAAAANCVGIL